MCFSIYSNKDANWAQEERKNWMGHFLSENPWPVLRVKNDGKLLYANRASIPLLEKWGLYEKEKASENSLKFPLEIKKLLRKLRFGSKPETLEIEIGKQRYFLRFSPSLSDEIVVISALELPAQKQAEAELALWKKQAKTLREKGNFLEALFEAIPYPFYCKDRQGIFQGCNELFSRQILGLSRKEILGHALKELSQKLAEELGQLHKEFDRELLKTGGSRFYEAKILCADGLKRDFIFSKAAYGKRSGKPEGILGLMQDITECKNAGEALVKIEEVRQREIHHRIKNNLQVVSSLLYLQSEKFEDEEVLEAFRKSEQRVISMALIHEELYRSKDVESIDFAAYLQKLTADLLKSYKVGNEEIKLHLEIEAIALGVDTAVPLGIIINELFSNSLKYAFPENSKGEIYIGLRKEKKEAKAQAREKETFLLTFSDNGIGLPKESKLEDFKDEEEGSLGLKLIYALVDQLEGK